MFTFCAILGNNSAISSITATSSHQSHFINSHSESLNHHHNNSLHNNSQVHSNQSNINSSHSLDAEVASINAGHDSSTFGHLTSTSDQNGRHDIQDNKQGNIQDINQDINEETIQDSKKGRKWEYMWVTQHHSVKDCPAHWTHPLNLLLKYAESANQKEAQTGKEAVEVESNDGSQSEARIHADSAAADTPVVDDNSSVISFITGQSK